jgi:hypothetical protein
MKFRSAYIALIIFIPVTLTFSQSKWSNKWMSVGSMHNWFSEAGCEIEEGLEGEQQSGWQWPAQYRYQDVQAWKGMWMGVKDFTEPDGVFRSYKVVHVGPRVDGTGEVFPVAFKTISKFEPSAVTADGIATYGKYVEVDEVDPALPYDRMLYNEVNTQLGVTLKRKIFQFSQAYHDNYIVIEYTFVNTGNTDADPEIERPGITLKDFYAYFQYRLSMTREVRYLFGNSAGWGVQTMIDARGDGRTDNDNQNNLRFQYAWMGKYTNFTTWDNIGGPIFRQATEGNVIVKADSIGRLGAPQFAGMLTAYADKSSAEKVDDPMQPSTTDWISSDDNINRGNSTYDNTKMALEYALMSKGHTPVRHAEYIEGENPLTVLEPKNDPSRNSASGAGYSAANGYGPYTLAPGDSIRIVIIEGTAGLSRDACINIGKQYKDGKITVAQKNQQVFTGKDSLFQTFNRAKANFDSNWGIPQPPFPPKDFSVKSSGGKIELSWDIYGEGPEITGFEIYRSPSEDTTGYQKATPYTKYKLAASLGPDAREFQDTSLVTNLDYYYYIVAVGRPEDNNRVGNTPAGALRSSRFYTQTYEPVNKLAPGKPNLSKIRVVPNPFILDAAGSLSQGVENKIVFKNLTGNCTIKIFTEYGELINTIEHTDGSGDQEWYSTTSSNQFVVSGVYIAYIQDHTTGETAIAKFVIIR